jgi:GDSL-like Lipase/Acylhydrolase family
MKHIVLLGDSIFDNKAYVGDGPDVVEQLRETLPSGWQATLLAIDGATTHDVKSQLERLSANATHLVVSAGGNDALGHADMLQEWTWSAARVLDRLADIRDAFQRDYRAMLDGVLAKELPTAVCTIYDARFDDPDMRRIANTALTVFNDAITREVFARGLPLIDLRLIFSEDADYANPIEPSVQGGAKLARAMTTLLTTHDFASPHSTIYAA